jgi:hypothetical protein
MWSLADELVDLDNISSNDIFAILTSYGVEAARRAIIQEVSSVFGAYGIQVDYRHLTIIADYMVRPKQQYTGRTLTRSRHTRVVIDRSIELVYHKSRRHCSRLPSRLLLISWRMRSCMEISMISRVLLRRLSSVNLARVERVALI